MAQMAAPRPGPDAAETETGSLARHLQRGQLIVGIVDEAAGQKVDSESWDANSGRRAMGAEWRLVEIEWWQWWV